MFRENVKLALNSLRGSKVRTFLTVLGVILGINFVILIIAIFNGIRNDITSSIETFGANIAAINIGDPEEGGASNPLSLLDGNTFTEEEVELVEEVEGVVAAAPQVLASGSADVRVGKERVSGTFLIGSNHNYPKALSQEVVAGEFFGEDVGKAKVVVIGKAIDDQYFTGKNPIGSTLKINNETHIVVGIMEEVEGLASSGFGIDINSAVIVPLETAKRLNGGTILIKEIDLLLDDEYDADAVVAEVTEKLKEERGKEDFVVQTQEDFLDAINGISSVVTTGAWLFSAVGLVVSGISIMNIMLVTVTERTREIGLRKAIGASSGEIMQQFVIESLFIGLAGGVFGVLFAWVQSQIIANATPINPAIEFDDVVLALGVSALAGIIFGLFPAWKAAKQRPIDALRYE